MSEDGPKLYANKPKKAQLKEFQDQHKGNDCSSLSSPTMAAAQASSAPPPQPPKESFARRYKFLWPLLLTVNLGVGEPKPSSCFKLVLEGELPLVGSFHLVSE